MLLSVKDRKTEFERAWASLNDEVDQTTDKLAQAESQLKPEWVDKLVFLAGDLYIRRLCVSVSCRYACKSYLMIEFGIDIDS